MTNIVDLNNSTCFCIINRWSLVLGMKIFNCLSSFFHFQVFQSPLQSSKQKIYFDCAFHMKKRNDSRNVISRWFSVHSIRLINDEANGQMETTRPWQILEWVTKIKIVADADRDGVGVPFGFGCCCQKKSTTHSAFRITYTPHTQPRTQCRRN